MVGTVIETKPTVHEFHVLKYDRKSSVMDFYIFEDHMTDKHSVQNFRTIEHKEQRVPYRRRLVYRPRKWLQDRRLL